MASYEEPQPSEIVSLVTRNEGDYFVHATASVYGGGSAAASPASKDGQVHDLQEALNEKELELLELKQRHAQLQENSERAQGSWVAALETRDREINQLSGELKSKERAISALSESERVWQATKQKAGEEQLDHEHKVQLLRSQVAQANANVVTLRAHLEAEQSSGRSEGSRSRAMPRSLSQALLQDSGDLSPQQSPPASPLKQHQSSSRAAKHTEPRSRQQAKKSNQDQIPRHSAPPPTFRADIAAAQAIVDNSEAALRPPSAPGNLQGRGQDYPGQLPRHSAVPENHSQDISAAKVLHQNSAQPSSATAARDAADSRQVSWSPHKSVIHTHQLHEEPSLRGTYGYNHVGASGHEVLLSNVHRAQDILRQIGGNGQGEQGHLWNLLQEQEALLKGEYGNSWHAREPAEESVDSLVPVAQGISPGQFGMLQERAHSAHVCALQFHEENEELQGRIAQLRVENEELRTMVSDRESSILELQLNNDMLTARLADSGSQVGQDPSEQDMSKRDGVSDAAHLGQLTEELENVQKRLVNRDAAAKKYKEGCRTLKERVEQLQQVCQKLKDRNIELVEAGTRAAAVQAEHEQELRKLLTQAQEDIEKHRKLASTAEQEKQSLIDRVDDMRRELKDAAAAQEETARHHAAMLEDERARTSMMLQQARGEVELEAAAASEEASQVLSRAEQLRQAAADTEAAATRKVEAANESTRIAETRLAEAREEVSRMQQRLLAAEEAASRDTRKIDTLARDVKAEQQHAAATLERLERAHVRIQQLESQLAEADDAVSKHKEAKRTAEERTADVRFKLQQAERRVKQEALATASVQERLEAATARVREAETRMAEAEHESAAQVMALREWECRVRESEETCSIAERKLQELKGALSQAEVEKNALRETMVQTEALIKQARHEHDQEISEATEAAAAEREVLQRKCHDLQALVERERSGRERAESCVKEAHAALEKHRDSLEENHTASLKAATTIHNLKERLRDKQADLEARDSSILELQGKLSQAHVRLQQQLAAKDSLEQARQLEAAEYADKENQLRAAQARLAEVAPLMRRLAGRSDNRIKAVRR